MDELTSPLTELQTPDEMALVFNPVGFGGRMEPEDAARFQGEAIADAALVAVVPTEITETSSGHASSTATEYWSTSSSP